MDEHIMLSMYFLNSATDSSLSTGKAYIIFTCRYSLAVISIRLSGGE